MNFDLSEDQELLKALAERFVVNCYDADSRRGHLAQASGFSRENWALLGELGLIAAPFAEEHGGLGLDATAIATVFEALGRGLVVEPLIENVLVAGRLFAACADGQLAAGWLPEIVGGTRRIAFAHVEEGARGGRLRVLCRAAEVNGGWRLDGTKACVPAGGGADGYVVSARDDGDPGADEGLALFLVPADTPGLEIRSWRMADGSVAVSLVLDGVTVPGDHRLAGGAAEIAAVEPLASLARSAEALGIMQTLFDQTLEYLKTREQFGVRLGTFQAIQHRMAAQYAAIEQARGLLDLAIVSEGMPGFAKAVEGARAFICEASVALGHEMIQFHGGMGVTDELAIGHGHKRLLVLSRWPEGPDAALDRYAGIAA